MKNYDIIIVGGGAAGFFTAINIGERNPAIKIAILERGKEVLTKVRISGGGRCNVTHACFEISSLVKRYPRGTNFLKKAFRMEECFLFRFQLHSSFFKPLYAKPEKWP